uniref:Glutaredoxin-dependent peroxiredoxin n=1 Tax=Wollemia nobilis TaxID=56998 RepID=A0A0C9RGU8_9CONI
MAATVVSNVASPCRAPTAPKPCVRTNPCASPSIRVTAAAFFPSPLFITGPRPLPAAVRGNGFRSVRRSGALSAIRATISVGDKLPEATLSYFDKEDELRTITVSELTAGKKVVLLAVPGAFTPTCSQKHLPGFVEKAEELKAKGVDTIACVSVNDAFVMKAWGKDLNVGDKVFLLADGNREFTKALGVELDLSDKPVGLGVRSRRYALYADDGVVKVLNLEEGGAFTVSGADEILKVL